MKKYFLPILLGTILISTMILMNCTNNQDQIITPDSNQAGAVFSQSNPEIQAVMAVQNKYTKELMSNSNIVGVGTGLNSEGKPAIIVFSKYELTDKSKRAQLLGNVPNTLEGKPVEIIYTGEIKPLALTSRYRPFYIGVSVGNNLECAAGTIGCIVKKNNVKYLLSNNHVFAREAKQGDASRVGEFIVQPGRYDNKPICTNHYNADQIAVVSAYSEFNFTGDNTIDAAIAQITYSGTYYSSTMSKFYGYPNSTVASAVLNMKIRKVGRTTELTTGTVKTINTTINVGYDGGTARFVGQITTSNKFCKAGDSGSLVITNDSNKFPIGLLFAGNSAGMSVLNPIQNVLDAFGVEIVTGP
jgi:hypothetical protein